MSWFKKKITKLSATITLALTLSSCFDQELKHLEKQHHEAKNKLEQTQTESEENLLEQDKINILKVVKFLQLSEKLTIDAKKTLDDYNFAEALPKYKHAYTMLKTAQDIFNKINPNSTEFQQGELKIKYNDVKEKLESSLNESQRNYEFSKKTKEKILAEDNPELKLLIDLVFAEVCEFGAHESVQSDKIIEMVASTVFNRMYLRPKEFGHSIKEVIYKKGAYYAVGHNFFDQARNNNIKARSNRHSYYKVSQLVREQYEFSTKSKRGKFQGYFYLTTHEIKKIIKKQGGLQGSRFDFTKTRLVYSLDKYNLLDYGEHNPEKFKKFL